MKCEDNHLNSEKYEIKHINANTKEGKDHAKHINTLKISRTFCFITLLVELKIK